MPKILLLRNVNRTAEYKYTKIAITFNSTRINSLIR